MKRRMLQVQANHKQRSGPMDRQLVGSGCCLNLAGVPKSTQLLFRIEWRLRAEQEQNSDRSWGTTFCPRAEKNAVLSRIFLESTARVPIQTFHDDSTVDLSPLHLPKRSFKEHPEPQLRCPPNHTQTNVASSRGDTS